MNYRVISTWSLKVAPSKEGTTIETNFPVKITNVALGDDSETPNISGRTTLKMAYEEPVDFSDSEDEGSGEKSVTAICSLSVGKVEHLSLDVVLHEHGKFTFTVSGENTVYLTGVQIDEILPDHDHDPTGDWDSDEEEDAFALQDVSSDVEMEADGFESDASRFEELHDEPKAKDKKRPRDSVDADADVAKPSKAEKKKAKKQKGQDGKAVPAEADADAAPAIAEKKEKKEKKEKGGAKELPGGLKLKDATIGTGPQAKKGQRIEMRYIGKLQNGKVFDSNTKGKPFAFRLGQGEVIKGWDEGIVGMQVGGERVLTIPPGLAYGKKGSGPIPPNATLTFECKLVNIK